MQFHLHPPLTLYLPLGVYLLGRFPHPENLVFNGFEIHQLRGVVMQSFALDFTDGFLHRPGRSIDYPLKNSTNLS